MLMAQQILRDFEVSLVDERLGKRMTEHMSIHVGTQFATNIAQRRLEGGVGQRRSLPFAKTDPERWRRKTLQVVQQRGNDGTVARSPR